jgi:hypothetical protein
LAPAGRWIFLIGAVVALLGGLYVAVPSVDPNVQKYLIYLLIIMGLVGGYLHITKEDEHHFILLVIGIAIFYQPFGIIPGDINGVTVGSYITSMLQIFGLFLGVAVIAIVFRNVIDWFRA